MRTVNRLSVVVMLMVLVAAGVSSATEISLNAVTFPERDTVRLDFIRQSSAPAAEVKAKVKIREGQAGVEIRFKDMKPAVLFGGDVTCYVVWAVTRDGTADNLGELYFSKANDQMELASGLKIFALMITAEPYALVPKPSPLVMFVSAPSKEKDAPTNTFTFGDFASPPGAKMDSIAHLAWDSSTSPMLLQAKKAFELAERYGAQEYASQILREGRLALSQAAAFSGSQRQSREFEDYSRRAVARASEAIQVTLHKKEAEALEAEIARRRAEMEAMEKRADEAEKLAMAAAASKAEAELALAEARTSIAEVERQKAESERMAQDSIRLAESELAALATEKAAAEAERVTLQESMAEMEAGMSALRQERTELTELTEKMRHDHEEMSNRLQGALSEVADTRESARGLIVNLPDILFDVNKANLKHEAQLVMAKLAGILLIMPQLNLRIEGHTDATGSDEHNQSLSERRAAEVRDFLAREGIPRDRMISIGYGENRPIADNDSDSGRRKNRRVEIIIGEGEIEEGR